MLDVTVNRDLIRAMILEKLEEKIKEIDVELLFWDSKELKRRTCMSWNTIQKEFFYDSRFSKYKIGSKWYFPAEETKQFLLTWLSEQTKQ
jgi:hypothetical protein